MRRKNTKFNADAYADSVNEHQEMSGVYVSLHF